MPLTGNSMEGSYLLGFDPGGKGRFGWAVAAGAGPNFLNPTSGVSDGAIEAVTKALSHVPNGAVVAAAGIDAPLFYSRRGAREADSVVRAAIQAAGCRHAPGTVQHPNSLRGACLIQGLLAVDELLAHLPSILITECHPKALRWLWPQARAVDAATHHERDAIIAIWSAWASTTQPGGWCDLLRREPKQVIPMGRRVGYWMPLAKFLDRDDGLEDSGESGSP